jgi:dUTP pyrophosphatase
MSEPRPLYLSVADASSAFETLQIAPSGALVKISGPSTAFLTPSDARQAIAQLQAILDWLEPPKPEESAPTQSGGVYGFHSLLAERVIATARLPTRAHPGDAGLDLYAAEDATIPAHGRRLVETGIAMAIPPGHVGLIWPRSGMAAHDGISTDAGVIDEGYRGPIRVLLTNAGDDCYPIVNGQKIAQLLVQPVASSRVEEVSELPAAVRGAAGFGSTGA